MGRMNKLDFVCVGPQRTATSWLDSMLRDHPQICLPKEVKETMFFEKHDLDKLPAYFKNFSHAAEGDLVGEIAPTYFDVIEAAEKIHKVNPDCKIIICLRDPVDRAFSLYLHHLTKGRVKGSLNEALQQNPRILESGRYSKYVPVWEKYFNNLHFICVTEVSSDPKTVLKNVCDFLGIKTIDWETANHKVGSATYPKFPGLAKITAASVSFFRRNNLHFIPEMGKRLGLKKIYTGAEKSMPEPSREERAFLGEALSEDIRYYKTKC